MANDITFDPASLDDPVAMKTNWSPARKGGSNIHFHKLAVINPVRMEFQATLWAKLCGILFTSISVASLIFLSLPLFSSKEFSADIYTIMSLLTSIIFIGVGYYYWFYVATVPIIFDKRKRFFWKGRKPLHELINKGSTEDYTQLERIYAVQLISEYCHGKEEDYYSYELNLVLENGQRINVVDHASEYELRDDATTLSRFLDKPVWDAI